MFEDIKNEKHKALVEKYYIEFVEQTMGDQRFEFYAYIEDGKLNISMRHNDNAEVNWNEKSPKSFKEKLIKLMHFVKICNKPF